MTKMEGQLAREMAELNFLANSLNGLVKLILDRIERIQKTAKSTD